MTDGVLFRRFRIAVLLYVLLFVAVASWLSRTSTTDWDDTLYLTLYPIAAEDSEAVGQYVRRLDEETFRSLETFLREEVQRYGRDLSAPLSVTLGPQLESEPPLLGPDAGILRVMAWSLRLRWWAWRATADDGLPTPDIRIFVRYFSPQDGLALEASVGLQKGLVGIVNAFADRQLAGSNNVVIMHELLHTLGASDKYDTATMLPVYPQGFVEPMQMPLYPQRYAEIMAGRIPVSPAEARIPERLAATRIGRITAFEIRLLEEAQ